MTGWGCQRERSVPLDRQLQPFRSFWKDFTYSNFKNLQDGSTKLSDHSQLGDVGDSHSAKSFPLWSNWAQTPESLSRMCIKGSSKTGLASNCHSGSIGLSDSLLFSSVPEKFPNKAEWICQTLMYTHTTRAVSGLSLRMGYHLGKLRKQLIRAPNPSLLEQCCVMQ